MNKDSKIYIAGHTGVIGSSIYKSLLKDGYTNVLVRSHSDLELTDYNQVRTLFEMEKPEYVFYCAGRDGDAEFLREHGAELFRMHILMQSHVIHSAFSTGVKRLLYSGSGACYGNKERSPFTEDCAINSIQQGIIQPYAASKIAGLVMCKAYNAQYGTKYISALPCHLFSFNNLKREKSNILEDIIKRITFAKREKMDKCHLDIWGKGETKTKYIFQEECADAFIFLMNHAECAEIVNVAPEEAYSLGEIANMIKKAINYQGVLEFETDKEERNVDRFMSGELLSKMGWKPKKSLPDRIKKLCDWYWDNSSE